MADFDAQAVHEYLLTLQDNICDALQQHETSDALRRRSLGA